MTRTEKLLRELIAIPSVNPAFVPPDDPHGGEQRVSDFLAGLALREHLEVDSEKVLPGRANLFVRLTPLGKPRQRLLLAPHLDTVGVGDERLFHPRLSQGRLYGRGACDTKGSVAAMFDALLELARTGPRPRQTEVVFAGLVDEECAQTGSRQLARQQFRADLAIVGEPTSSRVVTAHKGVLWLKLETFGKSAHGARPELGRNAILAMARAVECIEGPYASRLRDRRHPLLGRPTVNVGSICGGKQPNIVPDHCEITLDRRTLPGESDAGVVRELKAMLREQTLSVAIGPYHPGACAPLETSPRLPWVKRFLAVCGQRRPAGVDYFSDAAVLASGGIPSVLFGPGDIAQAHTPGEFVALRQLEKAQALLLQFLRTLP